MSLDIIGWKESAHVNIGYRRFKAFRCWCIGLMPLDFQLEQQLWWESAWDEYNMMKPGPYIEYTSFPDWNRTRMRRAAWEFFGHSDCEGGFEDTKETLRFLQWLSGRVVETGRYDADNEALLRELIDVFEVSDEVEFL